MECLGVPDFRFLELQKMVLEELENARSSLQVFKDVLRLHDLGGSFALAPIINDLIRLMQPNSTGLPLDPASLGPFIQSLISFAIAHARRALKYQARIPVPKSWVLVGVADEGYRYWKAGMKNMRALKEREVFSTFHLAQSCQIYHLFFAVAIRGETGEVEYLKGPVWVSRPPQVHPGDSGCIHPKKNI
jgi:RNA-dependent RNA polymerase